ncbi:PspA/IM30 family protein [Dongia rigui]|uniref:PspA/IM30 family protein n=1 Tax=Dongia rigui TaxID=940149 RepID=A0ABU5DZM0_9PROT|nr:PspA/IM30 family protein [Dongia rigui]MDY0872768.1 PspA/IM30 family protein [Dongia rigui]
MVKKRRYEQFGQCRLTLHPDAAGIAALRRSLDAYRELLLWLDEAVPADQSADLVALHRQYYESARARSHLPAQAVVLTLKDWAQRRRGLNVEGMPFDEKLFSVRDIQSLSLATVDGRISVPFALTDYSEVWHGSAPARLVERGGRFEFLISAELAFVETALKEKTMATENALSRIGRVISGMTHAAISAAEQSNPQAVMEQAVREIDSAADEVRVELGKALAEQHRVDARRKELLRERDELDEKLKLAVAQGRDDLAESGIARQLDIEAQAAVLDRLLDDVADRIAQLNQSLDAVNASRREAEERLKEMLKSQQATAHETAASAGGKISVARKVERAEAVISRVSGVPGGPAYEQAKAIDELNRLARQQAIQDRLAQLKSRKN